MKYILAACILIFSCHSGIKQSASVHEQVVEMSPDEVNVYYSGIRERLDSTREVLAKELKECTSSEKKKAVYTKARTLLVHTLVDSLFACWYGTNWDFNGTTTTPQTGNIACGYFVTTLIQHAGFDIQRIKLAQCASASMIDVLCPKKSIKIITKNQVAKVKEHLLSQPDGIFILGLDTHTGFVIKSGSQLEFVHSNYSFGNDDVTHEDFDKCSAIQNNNYFVIGNFSQSDTTIKYWLQGSAYVMN